MTQRFKLLGIGSCFSDYTIGSCLGDDALDKPSPPPTSPVSNVNQFTSMSPRFLKHCKGDNQKAEKMWREMLAWRQRWVMDTFLSRPLPNFRTIKTHYPQALHGRTKNGNLVFYEKPGCFNLAGFKRDGITANDMARYTAFVQEYIFSRLIPEDEGRFMSVLDMRGISWGIIQRDSIEILKTISEIIQSYYPERVSNMLVINAPDWFAGAWKFVERILAGNIERVTLHKEEETLDALLVHMETHQIPPEYGGLSPYAFGNSPEEQNLLEFVDNINENVENAARINIENDPAFTTEISQSAIPMIINKRKEKISWKSLLPASSPQQQSMAVKFSWSMLIDGFSPQSL